MNTSKLPKSLLVSLAAPVLLAVAVPAINAQSQTETKIRLMADGLRARDTGDLATAKTNFEQLLALAPNDVTVQRLLAGVNDQLAQASAPAVVAPVATQEPVEVVYTPGKAADISAPTPVAAAALPTAEVMARDEAARIKALMSDVNGQRSAAKKLASQDNYDGAIATLDAAVRTLPANTLTQKLIADVQSDILDLQLEKAEAYLSDGKTTEAQAALETYKKSPDANLKAANSLQGDINKAMLHPDRPTLVEASPNYVRDHSQIASLLAKGRSQYIAADLDGAQETFRELETQQPDNPDAKYFLARIAKDRASVGNLNREKTRAQLLQEVAGAWQRPGVYEDRAADRTAGVDSAKKALLTKLDSIIIPSVNFNNLELSRVVSTLSAISAEYDTAGAGVNLVLLDPANKNPTVSITLRNLSLKRILDFIVTSVGYEYEVQADAIVVQPNSGGDAIKLSTEFFAVTRSTVTRMTGLGGGGGASSAAVSSDPFAPAPAAGGGGSSGGGEGSSLQAFLQQAGVDFTNTPGSSLAYDGASIIVTQTNRNLERIRAILNRYNDVRQVEIEAKFMEVQEGALEEMGVNWAARQNTRSAGSLISGVPSGRTATTSNRSLISAFGVGSAVNAGSITVAPSVNNSLTDPSTTSISNPTPAIPGTASLGSAASDLVGFSAVLGSFDVTATIRALSQSSGTDLLSAPKVTVLSGNPANIAVAQELRYPQSYGEVQSQVSTGNGTGGVSITAGTPQDFTTRNVGVELNVTPTVEEDDYSISLDLRPKVTEFEGFVEYGGQSVAISGDITVNVPSGFYQPIFSVREISTKVTVWDGATLVMGGLTREEVKKVSDKIPVLGDIPVLGRFFQSKGETSSKRNLLIFVTANLVSPGGSPKKQNLKGVNASSMFQNPSVVTPAGSDSRIRTGQ